MRTEQLHYTSEGIWQKHTGNTSLPDAQLVLVFGNRELLLEQQHYDYIHAQYPVAQIIGCSTSGEIIGEELFSRSIACTAIDFSTSKVKVAYRDILAASDSHTIGEQLIAELNTPGLRHVLVFSEGLNINGSELTKGINSRLPEGVSVTGGLAGDETLFSKTVIVNNSTGRSNQVVAVGLYGGALQFGYASQGGWDSFGVDRQVTRSEGNTLYELDGQPALTLYKKYLGPHAAGLPASALLFPLSYTPAGCDHTLVRTVLAVNEKDGSMVFAGDISEGAFVRLMKSNVDNLIDGAYHAAKQANLPETQNNHSLALLISCVGRRMVMKQRVEEELEGVREIVGNPVTMFGFYSYGEICPISPEFKHCELHNQTMTITIINERGF
jgi:hypothetical protein